MTSSAIVNIIASKQNRVARDLSGSGDYFLNRFANAWRASLGAPEEVSRSTTVRVAKRSHWLRPPLFRMRAVIDLRHSKREPGSKYEHCRQVCRSALHFGQALSKSIFDCTIALQAAHLIFSPNAIIRGERGPSRSRGACCGPC